MTRRNRRAAEHRPLEVERETLPFPGRREIRSCKLKVRYETEAAAQLAADEYADVHGRHKAVYACLRCRGWHFGGRAD